MGSHTSWRQLLLSSIEGNAHVKHSKWFQLATVRLDGKPANRTVVFRGFQEGTDKLQFTTDLRSAKVDQMRASSVGEICWYFTETWEQFRILGVLDVIDASAADATRRSLREKAWFESSPKSRLQFAGPHPRLPLLQDGPQPHIDSNQGPLDTFCLVTLEPEEVDYLNLMENRRTVYCRVVEGNGFLWKETSVNP